LSIATGQRVNALDGVESFAFETADQVWGAGVIARGQDHAALRTELSQCWLAAADCDANAADAAILVQQVGDCGARENGAATSRQL
jgi:hypothetical protein